MGGELGEQGGGLGGGEGQDGQRRHTLGEGGEAGFQGAGAAELGREVGDVEDLGEVGREGGWEGGAGEDEGGEGPFLVVLCFLARWRADDGAVDEGDGDGLWRWRFGWGGGQTAEEGGLATWRLRSSFFRCFQADELGDQCDAIERDGVQVDEGKIQRSRGGATPCVACCDAC